MTINYNKAEFIRSAVRPEAFIRDGRPQVTFAGRSNVGTACSTGRTSPAWAPPPARPPR